MCDIYYLHDVLIYDQNALPRQQVPIYQHQQFTRDDNADEDDISWKLK